MYKITIIVYFNGMTQNYCTHADNVHDLRVIFRTWVTLCRVSTYTTFRLDGTKYKAMLEYGYMNTYDQQTYNFVMKN